MSGFTLVIGIIFGILALILGISDTVYAGYALNKEDKAGVINNTMPKLFLGTGIFIIIMAIFHIYRQYLGF